MSEPSARGDAGPKDAPAPEEIEHGYSKDALAPEEIEHGYSNDAPAPMPKNSPSRHRRRFLTAVAARAGTRVSRRRAPTRS